MVANPNEQIVEFEIKGPADLFAVAKAAGLPYSIMKVLNPELIRWCTPPYLKSYAFKLPLSVKDRFLSAYNDSTFDRRVQFTKYTARSGDSVQKIAHKFRTEADPIREINGMSKRASSLKAGSTIYLPIPLGYKRVLASMYDDKPMPARKKRRGRSRKRVRHEYTQKKASTRYHKRLPSSFSNK